MMSYNSELVSQLPPLLSSDDNLKLVEKVVAGDKEAREVMIGGNTAGVIAWVDNYLQEYPRHAHLRDDLTSAGFIGLTKAVNQLPDEYDPELGDVNNYIVAAIEREVYQTVEAENMVRIPHSTQYLATAKGKRIKPMTAAIVPMENFIGDDMEAIIDMRDLIDSCCENERELVFVEMREAGYTLKEVAEHFNMPVSTVDLMKKRIYARVLEKTGMRHNKKGKKSK